MGVAQLEIAREVRRRLGRRGLAAARTHLWARDCPSCHQTLDGHTPTLVVDEHRSLAQIPLHHRDCRASRWNACTDGADAPALRGASLTCTVAALGLSHAQSRYLLTGTRPDPTDPPRSLPALLVNPTLEATALHRHRRGWRHHAPSAFARLGLHSLTEGVDTAAPLPLATASVKGRHLAVEVGGLAWQCPAGPPSPRRSTASAAWCC